MITPSGVRYSYVRNSHGDVRVLLTAGGQVAQSYGYDAFGNQDGVSADANPLRYCGEYYDSESGNIYLRARYYDPGVGRFMSEDPARDGLNWYAYANNNPVNRIDPWGLNSWLIYNPHDFGAQKESEVMRLQENFGTPVHVIEVTTVEEFKNAWNSMGAGDVSIDGVTLLFHGSKDTINIDYANVQYLTINSNGKTPGGNPATFIGDKSVFKDKNIKKLYLQICSSGHLDFKDNNVASTFLNNYSTNQVIAWDGNTAYTQYLYFDNNNTLRPYYSTRLANNQGSYYANASRGGLFGLGKRTPVGRVRYMKGRTENLGVPYIGPNTVIAGRRIYPHY